MNLRDAIIRELDTSDPSAEPTPVLDAVCAAATFGECPPKVVCNAISSVHRRGTCPKCWGAWAESVTKGPKP